MTSDRSSEARSVERTEHSGFPLAALFLLTALCCVLAALTMQSVRSAITKEISWESLLVAGVVGALVGLVLGSLLGLAQRGPMAGLLVGGPTGFVLGAAVGPLCLAPVSQLSGIMGVTLGGSVLLVVVAVVIRKISAKEGAEESG